MPLDTPPPGLVQALQGANAFNNQIWMVTPEGLPYTTITSDGTEDVYIEVNPYLIAKEDKSPKSDKEWIETTRVRDAYRLPSPPQREPVFIESFIKNNNLTFKNPEFPFADKKARVGIEVEVENVSHIDINIPIGFWMVDEDGSLRNHGKEFKSFAMPLSQAQLALEHLFAGLNPDIDFSSRTSIHVHLDVRGLSMSQLLTLLFVYAVMENLLFKFVGANRRNNIFCTPITETRLFTDLNIRSKRDLKNHFQHVWQKYSALNLVPITTFGTVEFRQMPGTSDVTKLCIWLDLLSRMRLFAYRTDLSAVLETISDLNTSSQYRKFVEAVFGNLTAYLDTSSLLVDMEKAVYICKNCAAVNDFHQMVITSVDLTSQLALAVGVPKSLKTKLGEHYPTFVALLKGTSQNEEELYTAIRRQFKDYWNAFPQTDFRTLFMFIRDNPLDSKNLF